MSFGPSRLQPLHDGILKRYPAVIARFDSGELDWGNAAFAELKKSLRLSLRAQQEGRCIYCRRKILIERRNATEDIEHFLDKSKDKYKKWAFVAVNLALACHPCNMQKTTRDMGDDGVAVATELTETSGEYSWLHPYFDDYFENIEILDAWIYIVKKAAPRPARAKKMIQDCLLDQIKTIEADRAALLDRISRLQNMAMRCIDSNHLVRARRILKYATHLTENGWRYI
ncbi:hypothetical protein NPS49_09735 [Pseudomonas putida]|uniref:hypothetical protein n=1 Tax=Pseudomonas putida TaxID=303 RepID=UPI002364991B|nr:hypothetical protein [Pseudomonas putida]MDD2068597.1 hypothetical protein [Pseudomonas putida]HDS1738530.1 hypothetical protein [Pseudomonas putida]